jgi:pyruvate, orthophosphate dikinase
VFGRSIRRTPAEETPAWPCCTSPPRSSDLLGGKAASIVRLARRGIPVPPAFALITDECKRYYDAGREVGAHVVGALPGAMSRLESGKGGTFGGGDRPLLVSVRSGAAQSMPGMMDTIVDLGMTANVAEALERLRASRSHAAAMRRRFEQ